MIFSKHLSQIPRILHGRPKIYQVIQRQRLSRQRNYALFNVTAGTNSSVQSKTVYFSNLNRLNQQIRINRHFKCHFHTSSRRYVGPYVWVVLKTILKGGSILTGRGFRQWWRSLPDNKRLHFIHLSKKRWKEIIAGITLVAVFFYGFYLNHLQVAPITGRERFIVFNDKQFLDVMEYEAEQLHTELQEKYLPVNHPYYNVVVNTLQQLVNSNKDIEQLQTQKWTVAIIDDPQVNAFVLPTGHVFVHKGLMDFIIDVNQLAIVLGHEMAHALLKHGAEQLSKAQLVDYFIIMGMTLLWAFIPADGIAFVTQWFFHKVVNVIIHLPYNRALETEADKVGLELAAKACYDIRMGTVFWSMMAMNRELKGEQIPEWLSTHPASEKRSDLFDHLLPKYIEMRCQCKCPPLPDFDPRSAIPEIKAVVDNKVIKKKTAGNIERLKIPMTQYRTPVPPAALESNSSSGISVEILQAVKDLKTADVTPEVASPQSSTKSNEINTKVDISSSKLTGDSKTVKNTSTESLYTQESAVLSNKTVDSVKTVLPGNTSNAQNIDTKTT